MKLADEPMHDLLSFLGSESDTFDFDRWREGERTLLRPALEARGFTKIAFDMIEADSFGPLIRGCTATCHCGKTIRFFYG